MIPPPAMQATLARAHQEHLLAFWDRLDERARGRFLEELEAVDWGLLDVMRRLAADRASAAALPFDLDAAVSPPCLRLGGEDPIRSDALRRGGASLAEGAIGAILVAGGQGSRLGCRGPKGLCRVGPVSHATLFEMLLGKLVAVRRRHGRDVPLAIMTSSSTDADTRDFLATHDWCGLDPDRVFIFRQHDLPALDAATGRMLLDGPGHLALAPDGHGGMLVALARSGGLDWFARQGADHLVSFQVDNPLAMPLAEEFIGYHLLTGAEFSTQVVAKREPGERVGVVVSDGHRHHVVEYSDLSPELAAARLPDGRLRFHAGSIAVHAFARTFLERSAARPDALPLHRAHKAVPFLDETGTRVVPTAPTALKFERFIFDLMPLARSVCVVEVDPRDAFAPLKNPPGSAADTAAHVHAALVGHARRLLGRAGVTVGEGVDVELAADRVIDETDVRSLLPPGTVLDKPTVVGRSDPTASTRVRPQGD
ncbi:MAG: UTP--glucose-1-phosphate uridylyltransferase [Planctomycetia bacterium]